MENFKQMNRFDKWLLFLISVIVQSIIFGQALSFGAVFITMMDTFQTNRAETAAVQAIVIGMTFSFGIISGMLIRRFGPTMVILMASVVVPLGFCISYFAKHIATLYVSIGIITGIGNSLVHTSSIVLVERMIDGPQRLLGLSVLKTTTLAAAIYYPYLMKKLTEMYGLNGMFLILAGISLNVFVLFTMCWTNRVTDKHAATNKAIKKEKTEFDGTKSSSRKRRSLIDVTTKCFAYVYKLFHVPYALVLIASSFSLSSLNGYGGVMLDIALWKGITSSQGYITFVVFYSCSSLSCVIAGLLKQKKGVSAFLYPILMTLFGCCSQLLIMFASNYAVFMVGTALIGMTYGGVIASVYILIVPMVSQEQVPVATGLYGTLQGLLSLGVGPLYGRIRDISGSYKSVLMIVICIQAMSSALYTMALITNRRRKKRARCDRSTEISTLTRL